MEIRIKVLVLVDLYIVLYYNRNNWVEDRHFRKVDLYFKEDILGNCETKSQSCFKTRW